MAEHYGLAGGFVGATIFALGTSLPELVTAAAAARRKANELLIGNLLGSNLFNSLLVIGIAGVVGAGAIGERRVGEHVMMLLIGVLVGVMAITRRRWGRRQGVVLLASFVLSLRSWPRTPRLGEHYRRADRCNIRSRTAEGQGGVVADELRRANGRRGPSLLFAEPFGDLVWRPHPSVGGGSGTTSFE